MKKSVVLLCILMPVLLVAQVSSWEGKGISPKGTLFCLNIFVNVIYDIHPEYNQNFVDSTYWAPVTEVTLEGINNTSIPKYLLDWMDTMYIPHGTCTRLYGEASFDSLQIIGDFIVVNIRESTIIDSGGFDRYGIPKAAIKMINAHGFETLFHHNSYNSYDMDGNDSLDFVNIFIRNITSQYGGLNSGSGYNRDKFDSIYIGSKRLVFRTVQCVGTGNITDNPTNIIIHELSHSLFGGNDFHTSGGNHRGDGCMMPFLNIQCGYGLMGAAHSGLISCNGYERWRIHWKHPQSVDYISARNAANTQSVGSDITREDGNQTFLLRDFVTYGDAVRIKLPYKDSVTSSNQYIWLENHQVGDNNKLDFLQYSNTHSCRPQGTAGIYAYYQIGRDVLVGTDSEVWDSYHRDNLKTIPAEGYYDYELLAETYNIGCVSDGECSYAVRRGAANPLCGGQDQEFQFYPQESDTVLYISCEYELWRKKIGDLNYDSLSFLGDNSDAFNIHRIINMGTNPSTCNTKTYHSNTSKIHSFFEYVRGMLPLRNIQTTYLTGLSIEMTPVQGTGNFLVHVRWDDYNITNDTRWTGKISLKDTAVLTAGNTITLAQNRTVAQPTRDPETGLFAGRTRWTCENGSYFRQDSASALILTENSSVTFENGSRYDLSKDARVEIHAGCSLIVRPGAKIQMKGIVEVDSGGVLTLYDTAKMGNLSRLIVRPGGKLVVDGGILTSACPGEMWQGIEVVGDRTKKQLAQY